MSSSLVKIIIGAVFVILGAWWIVSGSDMINGLNSSSIVTSRPALADLITVANGTIPGFFILLGLLMIWLEMDTIKTQKELSKTE